MCWLGGGVGVGARGGMQEAIKGTGLCTADSLSQTPGLNPKMQAGLGTLCVHVRVCVTMICARWVRVCVAACVCGVRSACGRVWWWWRVCVVRVM